MSKQALILAASGLLMLVLAGCSGEDSPTGPSEPPPGGSDVRALGFTVASAVLTVTVDHAADGPNQVCGFVNGGDGSYCVPTQGTEFAWISAGGEPWPKVGTLLAMTAGGQFFANTSAFVLDPAQAFLRNDLGAIEVTVAGVESATSVQVQLYGGP